MIEVQLGSQTVPVQILNTTLGGAANLLSDAALAQLNGIAANATASAVLAANEATGAETARTGAEAAETAAEEARDEAIGGQVKTVSATSYTLLDADNRYNIRFTAATAVTVTVPTGLTHHYIVGLRQAGLGQITVSPAVGVTIANADAAFTSETQGVKLTLESSASNTYDLDGRTV